MNCPYCRSAKTRRRGHRRSQQRFRCCACRRWFSQARGQTPQSQSQSQSQPQPAPNIQEELESYLRSRPPLPPPPAKIRATRLKDMGFDTPQEMVACFGDYHFGSKIDRRAASGLAEYNTEIARRRLTRWRDGLLRFSQQDQVLLTVDTLHLLALGDDFEGHGKLFGSQGLQMDMSLGFQVVEFVEDMCAVLPYFLSRYKKIRVYKVRGNHGRITAKARDDYPPDNAELFAWQMIAERLVGRYGGRRSVSESGIQCYTGGPIEFFISPGFIMFLDILGWTVAIRHGHGLKGIASTYTGVIDSKLRMNTVVGQIINYLVKGHLHEAQSAEHEIQGEVIQSGCFVGPSLLSVEMPRAAANLPSQELWLMHPRHGITNRHRITLAEVDEVRRVEWVGRKP